MGTPLHIAVETHNLRVAEMLMDKSSDPTVEKCLPEDPESGGRSCFDLPECDDRICEILEGAFPTLYPDLQSLLDLYDETDKVLYLGVGAQAKLKSFFKSKAAAQEKDLIVVWPEFLATLGLDKNIFDIRNLDLFFSVLLNSGIRIGTLRNALNLFKKS